MTTPTTIPEPLIAQIRRGNRFLLTSHVNPDGDAVGSCLGLARVLRKLGKGATVWLRDPYPQIYAALPGSDRIHPGTEPPKGYPGTFSGVIVLECPSPERSGIAEHFGNLPVLNIDHHLGNEQYGAVNWVDTSAPAVGEMIVRMARHLRVDFDPDTANALYLTLVTDTGGFRFSNTGANAFEAAADLVREGASPSTVARWLYESQPAGAVRLLAEVLATLRLHHDERVATVRLTREMVARAGAQPGDAEGIIDHPRSIRTVEGVALLREVDDTTIKASLRSRGTVNVEKIARSRGGGGHPNAAGFKRDDLPVDGAGFARFETEIADALLGAITDAHAAADSAADDAEPEGDRPS
ncbi:MAG: bifunctional oligoribonuclease/PAP phosphatase NrnA [Acidobacteriota bacterium]